MPKYRKNIERDLLVDIVEKANQRSAEVTQGLVKRILTNSSFHPHGIKVQLDTGEVGRVVKIYSEDED